jgi:hypothetical protein
MALKESKDYYTAAQVKEIRQYLCSSSQAVLRVFVCSNRKYIPQTVLFRYFVCIIQLHFVFWGLVACFI